VRLLLLAALAGEHLLLLGPPGTAKSELARRMARLTGGSYYERLLTRFSVPEELFGPLSMKGAPRFACPSRAALFCESKSLSL
jgi:MoxR-like ATPase